MSIFNISYQISHYFVSKTPLLCFEIAITLLRIRHYYASNSPLLRSEFAITSFRLNLANSPFVTFKRTRADARHDDNAKKGLHPSHHALKPFCTKGKRRVRDMLKPSRQGHSTLTFLVPIPHLFVFVIGQMLKNKILTGNSCKPLQNFVSLQKLSR